MEINDYQNGPSFGHPLFGSNGADNIFIFGYAADVSAGAGDDVIRFAASSIFYDGVSSDQTDGAVSGGAGADTFVFEGEDYGRMSAGTIRQITDFELGVDALVFDIPDHWTMERSFDENGWLTYTAVNDRGVAQFLEITLEGITVQQLFAAGETDLDVL